MMRRHMDGKESNPLKYKTLWNQNRFHRVLSYEPVSQTSGSLFEPVSLTPGSFLYCNSSIQDFTSSSVVPAQNLLPSSQFPLPALSARFCPLLPIPLLLEVQNGITVIPSKLQLSTKVSMMRGSSPHQIGYPI